MSESELNVYAMFEDVVLPHVPLGRRRAATNAMIDVIDQYMQAHRRYHYITHLESVLVELRRWRWRFSERDYLNAFIALLLHDVVYHIPVQDRSNEVLSAEWVKWFVGTCGLQRAVDSDLIERAILITEGHQPVDLVSLAVCWCDLAGFTKDDETSKRYSALIAEEYLQVCTPAEYEDGRRAFLASYRSPFKTYPGASRWLCWQARRKNVKANRQLDRELSELESEKT